MSPWFFLIGMSFTNKILGGSMIARLYDDQIIRFDIFLFSYKAVHGDLIHMSQDQDNGFPVIGNYIWDAMKMFLVKHLVEWLSSKLTSVRTKYKMWNRYIAEDL